MLKKFRGKEFWEKHENMPNGCPEIETTCQNRDLFLILHPGIANGTRADG